MRGGGRSSSALSVIAVLIAFGAVALWTGLAGAMEHEMKMPMKSGEMEKGMKMKPGMEMKKGMKMEMATEGIFEGKGKVIALVSEKSQILISHKELIKGFMKAMPMGMGFAVESVDLLKGLGTGDPVKFKIDAAKNRIIWIEHLEQKK